MRSYFFCRDRTCYQIPAVPPCLATMSPTLVLPYVVLFLRRSDYSVSHTPPCRRFRSPSEVHSVFVSLSQSHRLRLSAKERIKTYSSSSSVFLTINLSKTVVKSF